MEDPKKNETATPGNPTEAMKQKYGKVYKVAVNVPVDDENEAELAYHFKRPSVPVYDRFVKTMSKIGISKASKTGSASSRIWRNIPASLSRSGISSASCWAWATT